MMLAFQGTCLVVMGYALIAAVATDIYLKKQMTG